MSNIEIVYNEQRNTWNVYVDGEWYFEGNYEQATDLVNRLYASDDEYYEDEPDMMDIWYD